MFSSENDKHLLGFNRALLMYKLYIIS